MADELRFLAAGKSTTGPVREQNEDFWFASGAGVRQDTWVVNGRADPLLGACVADGMGGHEGGREAAFSAASLWEELCSGEALSLAAVEHADLRTISGLVQQGLTQVHAALNQRSQERRYARPMGTTLTGLLMLPETGMLVAHVGDCRLYHFRNRLQQVTLDHTYLQQLLDEGKDQNQIPGNAGSSLTRCMGCGMDSLSLDMIEIPADALVDATLLLVSDGIAGELADARIDEILGSGGAPGMLVEALVDGAYAAGSSDNATAVIMRVERRA